MTYQDQLNHQNWKVKRELILKRDRFRCQDCLNNSLIKRFRISFHGAGFAGSRLIYLIFDNETRNVYRCKTIYDKNFLTTLLRIAKSQSILALTTGNDIFCSLIATIVIPEKLDFSKVDEAFIYGSPAYFEKQQEIQEKYLLTIPFSKLATLQWMDTKGLHIHHRFYQIGKLAWEYPDEAFQCLCWDCHENLHKNQYVKVFDEMGIELGAKLVCSRCHGAGWFPEYSHVQSGVCFKCLGSRFE